MMRCSTIGCDSKPTKQCSSCDGLLICTNCCIHHFQKHSANNTLCTLEEIKSKLSNSHLTRLRNNIEESIKIIENQKQNILIEAVKVNAQEQSIVKLAINELNQMIDEYSKLYNQTTFDADDIIKVNSIIKEKIIFEYPNFSNNEGSLTKNIKTRQFKQSILSAKAIEKDYGLLLEGHISSIIVIAITNDNHFVASGAWDCTVRVWNLIDKRQEAKFIGHKGNVNSVAITSDNQFVISGSSDTTVRVGTC